MAEDLRVTLAEAHYLAEQDVKRSRRLPGQTAEEQRALLCDAWLDPSIRKVAPPLAVPSDLCSMCGMRNDEAHHGRCEVEAGPDGQQAVISGRAFRHLR